MAAFRRAIRITLASLLIGLAGFSARAEVAVVVSPENPLATLTRTQLANLFLGRSSGFPDGGRVIPVDQLETNAIRKTFYTENLGWSQAQLKAHWSKIIFTGRGQPPKQLANDAEVKKFIANNPRGIGYIQKGNASADVKIVDIVP
ncbi:MAG: phosphate ABC transporter substrate-binding protein [Porticoccaceae bacterium]|jgi:ABC-type phosphate transport system substrate-binding protein